MEKKVSLPIKTKIAVWWMIITGIFVLGAFTLALLFSIGH
jgi:hypothetical protein